MDGELTAELEPPSPPRTRQRLVALAVAVLFVGAVAGGAVAASRGGTKPLPKLPLAPAPSSGAGAAIATPALAPYGIVKYEVQGTLPALSGNAPAYRLPAVLDPRSASRLASALGMHGSFVTSGEGTALTSGARTLTISDGPGLPWSYGSAVAYATGTASATASGGASGSTNGSTIASPPVAPPPATACPMPPCPSNALCASVCEPPTTLPRPVDLPSSADAEKIARATATAAGFDVTNDDVTVTTGDYSVSVELAPRLNGLPTSGFSWEFDLGSKGVIDDARGYLAKPAKVGNYPLAGTVVGLARLRQGMGVGPQPMMAEALPAVAYPVCAPSANCPLRTVAVTGVRLELADDLGYLVPAYVFTDASGTAGRVPATADAYLQLPNPVTPTTGGGGKGVPSPAPVPQPASTGSVNPGGPIVTAPAVGSSPCGSQPPPGSAAPSSCKG